MTPLRPEVRKLLIDEQLDVRLRKQFEAAGYRCESVQHAGFKGEEDKPLIQALRDKGQPFDFDALVTTDGNLPFQTNLRHDEEKRDISVLVIRTFNRNKGAIEPHIPRALEVLKTLKLNEVAFVGEPKLVHQDQAAYLFKNRRDAKVTTPNHEGIYGGEILGAVGGVTYQSVSPKQLVVHETEKLPPGVEPGQYYDIKYSHGKVVSCKVNEQQQERRQQARGASVDRGL